MQNGGGQDHQHVGQKKLPVLRRSNIKFQQGQAGGAAFNTFDDRQSAGRVVQSPKVIVNGLLQSELPSIKIRSPMAFSSKQQQIGQGLDLTADASVINIFVK